jgi:AraC-like DNA-binding protein
VSTALAVCHGAFGRITVYRLNRSMRTHAHREGHLIFHLGGAPATLSVSGTFQQVNESWGMAINPWQPHSFNPCPNSDPSIFLVAYLKEQPSQRAAGSDPLGFGANPIRFGSVLRSIAFGLADALVAGPNYRAIERGLSDLFEASLDASWESSLRTGTPGRRPASVDFRIRKSLRLLNDNLTQNVALDDVARDAGLSRPHFFKLFRDNTGVTPALYANTMRVERALCGLTGSTASVTEIGHELGFASLSHFTHFFAAHVGIPPMQYRTVARVVG